MTTFLVVDVILVVTFLVLLVMTLANRGTGDGQAAGGPTTTSPTAEESPEQSAPPDPEESQSLPAFVLPSGNIHCTMTQDTATCTILEFSYPAPEPPQGCTGTAGNVLTVSADGDAGFACVEAPVGPPAEGTPVLDYGEGSSVGEMTCLSSRNGVFCRHDPSGKGFSLARAGTQLF